MEDEYILLPAIPSIPPAGCAILAVILAIAAALLLSSCMALGALDAAGIRAQGGYYAKPSNKPAHYTIPPH